MKWCWAVFLLLGCDTAMGEDVVYQRCLDQMQVACERRFECGGGSTAYATQAECTTSERLKCEAFTSLSVCDGKPERYSEGFHTMCLDALKAQQCSEVGTPPGACTQVCCAASAGGC